MERSLKFTRSLPAGQRKQSARRATSILILQVGMKSLSVVPAKADVQATDIVSEV